MNCFKISLHFVIMLRAVERILQAAFSEKNSWLVMLNSYFVIRLRGCFCKINNICLFVRFLDYTGLKSVSFDKLKGHVPDMKYYQYSEVELVY